MACITCQHWQPKKSGEMARHGFAICAKGKPWTLHAPSHSACKKLEPVTDKVLQDRQSWLTKLGKRKTQESA